MADFTIYRKEFEGLNGGRRHDMYFRSREEAKRVLDENYQANMGSGYCKPKRELDYYNSLKGIEVYQKEALFTDINEKCTWSLIDGYFSDGVKLN